MFKGMPKVFWIGMGILYGWCFLFMILEMHVPGLPLMKVFGVPACYIYNWLIGLWLINCLVSYIFFVSEEKREKRVEAKKALKNGLKDSDMPPAVTKAFGQLIDNL